MSERGPAGGDGDLREEVLALAAELDAVRWEIAPFFATFMGLPGHDAEVPDLTAAA